MAVLQSTNISTTLVGNFLGENSHNVGTLCTSSKIHMLSKKKPVQFAHDSVDGYPEWWKGNNGNCGIAFTSFSNISDVSKYEWTYERPNGTANAPYRLGDFRGYCNTPTPYICSGVHGNITIDIASQSQFTIGQEIPVHDDPFSVIPSDFNKSNIGEYYFTAIIDNPRGGRIAHSADVKVKEGGITATLPTALFQSPIWANYSSTCIAVLSRLRQDYHESFNPAGFLPVYRDGEYPNPVNIYFRAISPVTIDLRSVGKDYANFHGIEENIFPLSVGRKVALKLIFVNNNSQPKYIGPNDLTVTCYNFSGELVEGIPTLMYTQSGSSVVPTLITTQFTVPANSTKEIVLYQNLFFRDRSAIEVAPNVNSGTLLSTDFRFYLNASGMTLLAGNTRNFQFRYDSSIIDRPIIGG